jgi:hypothetical protein
MSTDYIADEAGNPLLDEAGNPILAESSGGGGGGGGGAYIVQQVTGSVTDSYGIGTTAISSTAGNGMIAFIGWNCVTPGNYVVVPSACVSDSAGNLWKQIGITPAGTGVTSPTRSAVWATVNAQPVDWVSVGIAGYSAAAAWTIAEIGGLAQAIDIDYSVSLNGSGTAPTLTGVASETDIGFALFGCGSSLENFTGPAGWTALDSSVASAGAAVYPYWNTGVTSGSVTTAGHFTLASYYSLVQCGIYAAASPPPQYDFREPLVVVEAAFGATPGIASSSLDYTFSSEYISWTDISSRVIGNAVSGRISAVRGREYELQQEEAGSMTAYLSNYDGAFTPTNPGSPYYSNALNSNMSFQLDVSGWQGVNGAALSSSTASTYATGLNAIAYYSMLMTPNGSTAEPTALSTVSVPVNANYPYSFSCWMECPSGWSSGAYITTRWLNSAGGTVSTVTGSITVLPAGGWAQLTLVGEVPPSGAASVIFGPVIQGTPSAVPFYVAESAVVTGPVPVATGLVALETPVRITCWWQGRQYPLWMGYIERWPQGWPDMPQWGFSQVTATDALSIAAANSMQSALIGEVLIDNPYAYLPCNEQYTTQVVGATPTNLFFYSGSPQLVPVDANGQTAVNRAIGNQTSGVYFDGQSQQVSTGLSINFLGDDGTAMGAAGYSGNLLGYTGPAMQYTDPGLPAVASSSSGFTIEFWMSLSAENETVSLFSSYGPPSAFTNTGTYDNGISISVQYLSTYLSVLVSDIPVCNTSAALSINTPHHIVVIFPNPSEVLLYVDGVFIEETISSYPSPQLNAVILGPGRYSYDCWMAASDYYQANNYSAGHLAIYPYILPTGRITAHYEAGAAGWSGVSAAQRFAQVLDWAQLGLKRGGYLKSSATGTAEITQIGPAYQLNGSTASDAVNAIAQSEGGEYFVKADGTLSYVERPGSYNLAVQATLGDNATSAPDISNPNPEMEINNAIGWSAIGGGSVVYDSFFSYGPTGTVLFTPGTAATTYCASSPGLVAGGIYTTGAWVYSPTGGTAVTVSVGAAWGTVSSLSSGTAVPEGSWMYVQAGVTIPSGVTRASAVISSGTFPVYIAVGALMRVSPEVPYVKETEFDYDNSYLYNEVTATLESGPNDLTVYDDRNLPSEQSYFRRSALSIQSNVVSPYDVSDVTTWSIAEFSQPTVHVASVKVHASANPVVAFPVVLNLDLGDIIQVNRRPIGGAVIAELGIIEKISYEIGPRYFYVTYQISPYAPSNNVLCADTSGYDDPSTNSTLILGW